MMKSHDMTKMYIFAVTKLIVSFRKFIFISDMKISIGTEKEQLRSFDF